MLSQRAQEEIVLLPFASVAAAQAAIDARNARFRLSIPWAPAGSESPGGADGGADGEGPYSPGTISERLVKAEKAAEQFVARRLQPAVQRTAGLVKETSPDGVVEGIKSSAWLGGRAAGAGQGCWCRAALSGWVQPAVWQGAARCCCCAAPLTLLLPVPPACRRRGVGQGPVEPPQRLARAALCQGRRRPL